MPKKILLSGCGNIGFRHLQAIVAVDVPSHVTIVEPATLLHPRIIELIGSPEATRHHTFSLCSEIPSSRQRFDLAIIATSANIRKAVFVSILEFHEIEVVLFEKVLFQTIGELDQVQSILDRNEISAFVNCGRRGFASYRSLLKKLDHVLPTDILITGGAFGLASNGIHLLDLAEFLNNSPIISIDVSGLSSGSVPSKRSGFVEIFGTIKAELENGAKLSITCSDIETIDLQVNLKSGPNSLHIDEVAGTISSGPESGPFTIEYVSGMSQLYKDALLMKDPGLTPYRDSARQHRFFLKAICDHLGLPSEDGTICPIS